jgi:hypothetical protein
MMGERMAMPDSLFYEFRFEEHVPAGSFAPCESTGSSIFPI